MVQVYASKYKLYMPTEEEFKKELNLDEFKKISDWIDLNLHLYKLIRRYEAISLMKYCLFFVTDMKVA